MSPRNIHQRILGEGYYSRGYASQIDKIIDAGIFPITHPIETLKIAKDKFLSLVFSTADKTDNFIKGIEGTIGLSKYCLKDFLTTVRDFREIDEFKSGGVPRPSNPNYLR